MPRTQTGCSPSPYTTRFGALGRLLQNDPADFPTFVEPVGQFPAIFVDVEGAPGPTPELHGRLGHRRRHHHSTPVSNGLGMM